MAQFVPRKEDKEVISVRLSRALLENMDAAAEVGISRNEFLNQCFLFAMQHLKPQENNHKEG